MRISAAGVIFHAVSQPETPLSLPHTPHGGRFNLTDERWFLLGLLGVAVLIAGLVYWVATSTHSAELAFEHLEADVRSGVVWDLKVSGHEIEGKFRTIRQAYDGQVRGRNESVPEGYSDSDAEGVNEFTATIPDGERDRFIELTRQNNVTIEVD